MIDPFKKEKAEEPCESYSGNLCAGFSGQTICTRCGWDRFAHTESYRKIVDRIGKMNEEKFCTVCARDIMYTHACPNIKVECIDCCGCSEHREDSEQNLATEHEAFPIEGIYRGSKKLIHYGECVRVQPRSECECVRQYIIDPDGDYEITVRKLQ